MAEQPASERELLSPQEVKRIRENLGLTQVEAGELLGGGLRAFQKYESGVIKPAATTSNLLRLLDADPSALRTLAGRRVVPIDEDGLRPFEVSAAHIAALSPRKLVMLTRRLLVAEAAASEIPLAGLHVSSNLTAPDGGEDGRVEWQGGPARTAFLPSRVCQIQVKASSVGPTDAAKDLQTSVGNIEPGIAEVLSRGGAYIVLCSRPYTHKQITQREEKIRAAIRYAGIAIEDGQVDFRDAEQIAAWANEHSPVATWILEQTQPGLANSLRTWSHWAGRHEHESLPFVVDMRLDELRPKLRGSAMAAQSVVRVVGLSGIGKSRLVLESLSPTQNEEQTGVGVSDLVLFGVESEIGSAATKSAVQTLVDNGKRAVIVIDRCTEESHQDLAAIVKRSTSRASLITIDHELPKSLPPAYIKVEPAASQVIQDIFKRIAPGLQPEDERRLVRFADGFPQLAVLVGQAWLADLPLATSTDEVLVDRVVFGRKGGDGTLETAQLLSAFGVLGYEPPLHEHVEIVAHYSRGLSSQDLRAHIADLRQRGLVQARGRLITLQPRPIAASLAERQWREWSPQQWDEILAGALPIYLRQQAARQLAVLNTVETAEKVCRYVCRQGGPLDGLDKLAVEGTGDVLTFLSEIDAGATVGLLERVLAADTATLRLVTGDTRRSLVRSLERIAFCPDTFARGAKLLLRLAMAENERWGNNATGQFKALFPVFLADTAADGASRFGVLDEVLATAGEECEEIVVEALLEGAETDNFNRVVGAESHGLRPALEPWKPKTWREVWDYIRGCLDRLLRIAMRSDSVGQRAKTGLGHRFRFLVKHGLIDFVEAAVSAVVDAHGRYWPDALSSLGDALSYDSAAFDSSVQARIRSLIVTLTPDDLANRVRLLVTEMPWDYPCGEDLELEAKSARQQEVVDALVKDALREPETLDRLLPTISQGPQRMAGVFGSQLAIRSQDSGWLERALAAYRSAPPKVRNPDLLTSYVASLSVRDPQRIERLKRVVLRSRELAPLLPLVCWKMGITADDITLVCRGLARGVIRPQDLHAWTFGGKLAETPPESVAPLFDQLLTPDANSYEMGLELFGMYVFGRGERLEQLRPQLRLVAERATRAADHPSQMADHHFKELMVWALRKGRSDADACAIALALAKATIAMVEHGDAAGEGRLKPIVGTLLTDFPEVVWPLLGAAIVADKRTAWHFELILGDKHSFAAKSTAPFLGLPEATLAAWWHAYPEVAPAYSAAIVPILTTRNPSEHPQLHPLLERLLNEFGERSDVQRALSRNLYTFGWTGSRASYFALFEEPLKGLDSHPKREVRQWAKRTVEQVRRDIEDVKIEDEEHRALQE